MLGSRLGYRPRVNPDESVESGMPSTHLALLRGINVGGKNMLPMKDLAAFFQEAGGKDVRTYIQSGNVLFNATERNASRIPELVTVRVGKRFGFEPPIVVRSAAEVAAVVEANPYPKAVETDGLYVRFLADDPGAAMVKALDPKRSHPDVYSVIGREIYMNLLTGAAKTKLTNAYFDSKLATISTSRNWRTTTKLLAMMSE